MKINPWKPWFYAGPYVPSGVIYGEHNSPSRCEWLVPGYNLDSWKINLYE